MSEAEIHGGQNAVEEKLAEIGFGRDRIDVRQAAPDEGTPAEEVVQADQPRDDLGRFVGEQPEAEVPEPEQADEPQQVPAEPAIEAQDPAVAALLQKYGGDVDKALQGAVHLQRKAGEQSNELGDLRRMVDELTQLREGIQQQNQYQQQPVMDQATVDWFDQQTLENPYQMAEYARQQNNGILMQRALSTWKDIDPYQAAVYTNELRLQEQQKQFEERLTKVQQLPMDSSINVALTNVRSRNPQYANYDDGIATAMEKYPSAARAVQFAAESGNSAELEAAIETLYGLAIGDTLQQIALTGPAPESTTTTSDVAAPTISEPHEAPPAPTAEQQFREAFRQEIDQRRRGVFVAE